MKPHYTELRLRTGVFANHSSRKGSKVAWSTKQAVTPSWKSGNAGFQVDLSIAKRSCFLRNDLGDKLWRRFLLTAGLGRRRKCCRQLHF